MVQIWMNALEIVSGLTSSITAHKEVHKENYKFLHGRPLTAKSFIKVHAP